MFKWLYRRIARAIWVEIKPQLESEFESLLTPERLGSLIQKTLALESVQDEITSLTDALYDRYKQKVMGFIGGSMKGTIEADTGQTGGLDLGGIPIPAKYKKLLSNPFVKMLAGGLIRGKSNEAQNESGSSSQGNKAF